ncbi:MAG TPA: hypothetical protein VLF18_19055 [Tahibacter sp.]|uniref:hypothetical protein n=1 Tax=Tahibacter sp. TaxID=2056211 RepID=UPI002C3F4FC9|nr:hypothetical protein [Tahibacter sp.]HSX62288.1 hypothetical protein [Tahibacter sp.]
MNPMPYVTERNVADSAGAVPAPRTNAAIGSADALGDAVTCPQENLDECIRFLSIDAPVPRQFKKDLPGF